MPELSEDKVREALKQVIDPELFVNIVDLGLIYTVDIQPAAEKPATAGDAQEGAAAEAEQAASIAATDEHPSGEASTSEEAPPAQEDASAPDAGEQVDVKIEMTMTSPACPAGPQLLGNSKQVVSRLEGVRDVEVKLVMDPPWTPDRMTEDARDQLGIF